MRITWSLIGEGLTAEQEEEVENITTDLDYLEHTLKPVLIERGLFDAESIEKLQWRVHQNLR